MMINLFFVAYLQTMCLVCNSRLPTVGQGPGFPKLGHATLLINISTLSGSINRLFSNEKSSKKNS